MKDKNHCRTPVMQMPLLVFLGYFWKTWYLPPQRSLDFLSVFTCLFKAATVVVFFVVITFGSMRTM